MSTLSKPIPDYSGQFVFLEALDPKNAYNSGELFCIVSSSDAIHGYPLTCYHNGGEIQHRHFAEYRVIKACRDDAKARARCEEMKKWADDRQSGRTHKEWTDHVYTTAKQAANEVLRMLDETKPVEAAPKVQPFVRPFKKGDKVVCVDASASFGFLELDGIYTVCGVDAKRIYVAEDDSRYGWFIERFRLATADDLKVSYKVGDWVYSVHGTVILDAGKVYRVERVEGDRIYVNTKMGCLSYGEYHLRKATPAEVEQAKEEAAKVVITVDGQSYQAVYHEGYVQFGCAKLDNRLIRAAEALLRHGGTEFGNRVATAVTLGKGVFDQVALTKLVANLKEPDPTF